ncbi:MAG TPA: gas vesicle protein GvpG [Thermoanaerobaculia bacterium]
MAFLLDDILLLPLTGPISGFKWIMRTVQKLADEELLNDQPWKERLIELQMRLELGEISEEDYVVEEKVVFQALRDIRARREEMAREAARQRGDDEDTGIGIYTGYGK